MIRKQYDQAEVKIYTTRTEMGAAAAQEAARCIHTLLQEEAELNTIFAAAPSQLDFLAALAADPTIPWHRINAYHMDEYVGLAPGHPASFGQFLSRHLFDKVPFKSVHLIDGNNDPAAETARYTALLQAAPTHITFMGIGENGHIAFNDPAVADFHDPLPFKMVDLDEVCRRQQVHDGCFARLEDVPRHALTVTVPRLTDSGYIFCMVPTALKHDAVKAALTGPIQESCPASILRRTPHARIYLDAACAGDLAD